jgi:cytochrome c2
VTAGRRLARALLGAALAVACAGPDQAAAQAAGGDLARGAQLFGAKMCGHCHRATEPKGPGPLLSELRRPQGAYELSGRLWNHAPAMFTALVQEGLPWPEISETEMADLMAYLGADAARDPRPDRHKGLTTLVSKGCLKCHAFRGEGARIAPDLATVRDDYAPPARWASRMWSHTPRISQKAMERGIPYPRFTGDEMAHLLGFLRAGGPEQ